MKFFFSFDKVNLIHSNVKNIFDYKINLLKKHKVLYIYDEDYDYYLYSIFVKKNFLKRNKKIKKINIKNIKLFLQICMRSGNKIKVLNFLNKMRSAFYYYFLDKSSFLEKKFTYYDIFYNFALSEKKFFDVNFLIDLIFFKNRIMFTTNPIKLNKKSKKKNKTKSKYKTEIQYLNSEKRLSFLLKQIYLYSSKYNYYNHSERILMSFLNVFFLDKSSDIYNDKILTYSNIIKKNLK